MKRLSADLQNLIDQFVSLHVLISLKATALH